MRGIFRKTEKKMPVRSYKYCMRHNTTTAGIFLCTLFFLSAVLSVSCENSFLYDALYTKTLTISTPGKTGTLLWIDDKATVRRKTFPAEAAESTVSAQVAQSSEVAITVSKGYATPVLFFSDDKEHPEGFVYPFTSTFTEAGGFAAHILYRFIKDADDSYGDKHEVRLYSNHFNWEKFQELVEQSFEKGENPWGCDQTLILESIAYGSFTPHVLKP